MISRKVLINWLQLVIATVFIYSLILVFAGAIAGELFSLFGFGPNETINTQEFQDYLLLPYMVSRNFQYPVCCCTWLTALLARQEEVKNNLNAFPFTSSEALVKVTL